MSADAGVAKHNSEPPQRLGYLNDNIGQILSRLGRTVEALHNFEQAVDQVMQGDEPDGCTAARVFMNMAGMYSQTGRSDDGELSLLDPLLTL